MSQAPPKTSKECFEWVKNQSFRDRLDKAQYYKNYRTCTPFLQKGAGNSPIPPLSPLYRHLALVYLVKSLDDKVEWLLPIDQALEPGQPLPSSSNPKKKQKRFGLIPIKISTPTEYYLGGLFHDRQKDHYWRFSPYFQNPADPPADRKIIEALDQTRTKPYRSYYQPMLNSPYPDLSNDPILGHLWSLWFARFELSQPDTFRERLYIDAMEKFDPGLMKSYVAFLSDSQKEACQILAQSPNNPQEQARALDRWLRTKMS